MKPDEKIRVLETSLARTLSWISAADTKATLIFALAAAMLGSLAAMTSMLPEGPDSTLFFIVPSALLLGLSLLMLSISAFPRTSGPTDSIIFFQPVSRLGLGDFIDRVEKLDNDSYILDLERQCYRNAQIAASKFNWLQRSTALLYMALPLWLLTSFSLIFSG